jgi:type IV pilus assembly protein PilY1
MKTRKILAFLAAAAFGWQSAATAEDIDLFLQPPGSVQGRPNVLFIIDNTANWSTAFANEKQALVNVFNNLQEDRVNIGIMMFGDPDVGLVRAGIRPMSVIGGIDYRQRYAQQVADWENRSMQQGGDRANGRTLARTFSEAYRYLKGQQMTVPASASGNWNETRDYTGNTVGRPSVRAVHALPVNPLSSSSDTTYTSPLDPNSCFGTYIIYIGNTTSGGNVTKDNASRNTAARNELAAAGGNVNQIPLSPSAFQDNWADEWSRHMRQELGVVTYTIDVDPGSGGNGPGNTALLKSMANVSDGRYFAVNSQSGGGQEIELAINEILSEIQAVNSVFASVSLPVSVNTQGFYLNQVYVGLFRPDEQARPRWYGNLKQYKLGVAAGALRTLDADDNVAINTSTGFITQCARSFWTDTNTDLYWQFRKVSDSEFFLGQRCGTSTDDAAVYSNFPDGPFVEKGAQAYRLRGTTPANRNMWTCTGSCASLEAFSTASGVDATMLDAIDTTERNELINWYRGADLDDENKNLNTAEMRPSAHGDVVHSRPVAINYGATEADNKVIVFYGGNDGVLRAINGNRIDDIGVVPAGNEMWSFVPPQFFPQIKRMRGNDPKIAFTGSPTDPPRASKPYGVDGPLSAFRSAGADPDTWIFAGMRRGGRMLYSFDVSGLADDTPVQPSLKWRIGCPNLSDDTGCTTGMSGIGQTWSEPKVLKANGHVGPLLIFGGGYDTCEDGNPADDYRHTCTDTSKGRYVYVLDANTGTRLVTLETERPVVGDVFVVTNRQDDFGVAMWAYVADMGGNVYRISGASANAPFGSTPPDEWTITKIAALGCDALADCDDNRKFMFNPDVVGEDGVYYLLIGSGDREKPLQVFEGAMGTQNYFFMIKDVPTNAAWLTDACGSEDSICTTSLVDVPTNDPTSETLLDLLADPAYKGWKLPLRVTAETSEQVVTSGITVFGVTTFSTHEATVNAPGVCTSNLGTARVYNLRFRNAAAANNTARDAEIAGGGLPPSPVAGEVKLDDGTIVPFVIGASATSPLDASLPLAPATGSQPKAVTYWYIEK